MTEELQGLRSTAEEFESIRAYVDEDLQDVLPQLLRDKQLLDLLAAYRLKKIHSAFPLLARWILRLFFAYKLRGVNTIFALQEKITGSYFFHMLEQTVSDIHISGLESLPEDGGALLISNHRDIVLDPTFVDYALYTKRQTTARLATGDNLAKIPFAKHLMRLNKSFWLKREETSPRKIFANLKTLSRYIRVSIKNEHEFVWIAQREGRAKDGVDRTEESVLKMLCLANHKASLKENCEDLRIIPVSISYELDPCDKAKATELEIKARTNEKIKDDTKSVTVSLLEPKGRVALHFCKPIQGISCSKKERNVLSQRSNCDASIGAPG